MFKRLKNAVGYTANAIAANTEKNRLGLDHPIPASATPVEQLATLRSQSSFEAGADATQLTAHDPTAFNPRLVFVPEDKKGFAIGVHVFQRAIELSGANGQTLSYADARPIAEKLMKEMGAALLPGLPSADLLQLSRWPRALAQSDWTAVPAEERESRIAYSIGYTPEQADRDGGVYSPDLAKRFAGKAADYLKTQGELRDTPLTALGLKLQVDAVHDSSLDPQHKEELVGALRDQTPDMELLEHDVRLKDAPSAAAAVNALLGPVKKF
jgi:hypothetical protein